MALSPLDISTDLALESAMRVAGYQSEYKRDNVCISVDVIPGNTTWDEISDMGVVRSWKSQDFIMKFEIMKEYFCEPKDGDGVVYRGDLYNTMSPGGDQPWRWCGRSRNWIRVFTKKVIDSQYEVGGPKAVIDGED